MITQCNIYRDGKVWCYSAWSGDDHDHNDTLDSDDYDAAKNEVSRLFPDAAVRRIEDITG